MKRKAKLLAINAKIHALDIAARSPRKGHTTRHSETAMTTFGGMAQAKNSTYAHTAATGKFFS